MEHIKLQEINRLLLKNLHRVCVSDIFDDTELSSVNGLFDEVVRELLQLIESSQTALTVSI